LARFSVRNDKLDDDDGDSAALAKNPGAIGETLKEKPSWRNSFVLRRFGGFGLFFFFISLKNPFAKPAT